LDQGQNSAAIAAVDGDGLLHRHEIPAVFTPRRLDGLDSLSVNLLELHLKFVNPSFERHHPLDTHQVQAVVRELLNSLEQRNVGIGVAATSAARARWLDKAPAFVDSQSLGMDSGELGSHRYDIYGPIESVFIHDQ